MRAALDQVGKFRASIGLFGSLVRRPRPPAE
jgi:hypothetical protein